MNIILFLADVRTFIVLAIGGFTMLTYFNYMEYHRGKNKLRGKK